MICCRVCYIMFAFDRVLDVFERHSSIYVLIEFNVCIVAEYHLKISLEVTFHGIFVCVIR